MSGYYRLPRTMNEMRAAADVDVAEFVRGARSVMNLPNAWDDIPPHRERCWKSQRKARKAWGR